MIVVLHVHNNYTCGKAIKVILYELLSIEYNSYGIEL